MFCYVPYYIHKVYIMIQKDLSFYARRKKLKENVIFDVMFRIQCRLHIYFESY